MSFIRTLACFVFGKTKKKKKKKKIFLENLKKNDTITNMDRKTHQLEKFQVFNAVRFMPGNKQTKILSGWMHKPKTQAEEAQSF